MANVAIHVIYRLRLDGQDLKSWAIKNGFKPDTVYKTVYGKRGVTGRAGESARIKGALMEGGYWPEDLEATA